MYHEENINNTNNDIENSDDDTNNDNTDTNNDDNMNNNTNDNTNSNNKSNNNSNTNKAVALVFFKREKMLLHQRSFFVKHHNSKQCISKRQLI